MAEQTRKWGKKRKKKRGNLYWLRLQKKKRLVDGVNIKNLRPIRKKGRQRTMRGYWKGSRIMNEGTRRSIYRL